MFLPNFQDAHLVNDRSLSAVIRLFNGKVVYSFMMHPVNGVFYQHLMVNTEDHNFETIPVYS